MPPAMDDWELALAEGEHPGGVRRVEHSTGTRWADAVQQHRDHGGTWAWPCDVGVEFTCVDCDEVHVVSRAVVTALGHIRSPREWLDAIRANARSWGWLRVTSDRGGVELRTVHPGPLLPITCEDVGGWINEVRAHRGCAARSDVSCWVGRASIEFTCDRCRALIRMRASALEGRTTRHWMETLFRVADWAWLFRVTQFDTATREDPSPPVQWTTRLWPTQAQLMDEMARHAEHWDHLRGSYAAGIEGADYPHIIVGCDGCHTDDRLPVSALEGVLRWFIHVPWVTLLPQVALLGTRILDGDMMTLSRAEMGYIRDAYRAEVSRLMRTPPSIGVILDSTGQPSASMTLMNDRGEPITAPTPLEAGYRYVNPRTGEQIEPAAGIYVGTDRRASPWVDTPTRPEDLTDSVDALARLARAWGRSPELDKDVPMTVRVKPPEATPAWARLRRRR